MFHCNFIPRIWATTGRSIAGVGQTLLAITLIKDEGKDKLENMIHHDMYIEQLFLEPEWAVSK